MLLIIGFICYIVFIFHPMVGDSGLNIIEYCIYAFGSFLVLVGFLFSYRPSRRNDYYYDDRHDDNDW